MTLLSSGTTVDFIGTIVDLLRMAYIGIVLMCSAMH